ncbi:hypothetical protein MM1S1540310_0951 [Mycobacteroides abscessus subsp. bolletii 1S-154-0310]|uniref:Uncharacterized protein n=1 Tax=Mycobacteroides abscessus MAB_091912_2446 TaxID=1335414 RepID=A0A829M322_9MYCO|nr:hypothetical protein MM1S1510930_1392 [Mycobacteroides abscessus subsp. bolletii 1S-151-0930]EIU67750.1 hypothetical protein MM1S1520914_1600 [Mycobacteroides abscessus subsp. bolletii 1S-152-0914]EIU77329.1 hypothetical protein MM1S1530915_0938 [Mycobacteroides abscessus subsp. bolletii 1S-153-0915]EIU84768.1 hypothetical protein MM1S1540310_0951 [Mycobacteroides abscessus subsp. bolletii 1S-154-0310]ESV59237.1 hypothetical protein L830_5090 [Mycobacteroides abscessus MAB_082312_2258]ESV62
MPRVIAPLTAVVLPSAVITPVPIPIAPIVIAAPVAVVVSAIMTTPVVIVVAMRAIRMVLGVGGMADRLRKRGNGTHPERAHRQCPDSSPLRHKAFQIHVRLLSEYLGGSPRLNRSQQRHRAGYAAAAMLNIDRMSTAVTCPGSGTNHGCGIAGI